MKGSNELRAKKALVIKQSSKFQDILSYILKNPDIYQELMLQITYNTNSIEGSTLSQAETAAVLFENTALPNKTLIEQLEAKNHQTAFRYLLQWLQNDENAHIDETLILKLHATLMNGIIDSAGTYRNHPVRIVGVNVITANYMKLPVLMKQLIKEINAATEDVIEKVSVVHSKFEQIHPFADGNGRIGRLLIIAMLLKENIAPALIKRENKSRYIETLNKAQTQSEYKHLQDFICDAIFLGLKLINRSDI